MEFLERKGALNASNIDSIPSNACPLCVKAVLKMTSNEEIEN